jgi:hypothetical protein
MGYEGEPEAAVYSPGCVHSVISLLGEGGSLGSAEGGDSIVQVRVAIFSPTLPHPIVYTLRKVPFLLPDIIVDQTTGVPARARVQGVDCPSWNLDPLGGLECTAEEIKEVVPSN